MVQVDQQTTPQLSATQVGRRIFRATAALMLIQVIMRGFGLIQSIIMTYYFGTGEQANAFSAANRIANPVLMFGEQVFMHSFLPPFVQRMREHGEEDAWRMASTTINILIILMAVIAAVGMAFTHQVLGIFLPGWVNGHGDLVAITVTLSRIMLVAMIFLAVASLTYCLLNSYKQFALPASADMVLKGGVLVFAIFFAQSWGALALAAGFLVGAIGKVIVHAIGLRDKVRYYRPVVQLSHPGLMKFAWLALPLIIGWGFSTMRGIMETRFLSLLHDPAGMSALDYAKKICDIPVSFFPFVFGIALFPFLAEIAVSKDTERLRRMLMSATRMMILIFIPLAVVLITLRYPILLGLYGSKKFTMASAIITAAPLQIYAIAMLAGALEIIVNQFYFALSDTVRPTLVGICLVPVHIAIGYYGVTAWGWEAVAIALAMLVYRSGKVVVLYTMIRKKLGSLEGGKTALMLGKISIALLPMILILLLALHLLPTPGDAPSKVKKLIALLPYAVAAGTGMLAYIACLHFLKVEEVSLLIEKVRSKFRRTPVSA
ncbi:MAG: murein biosynthesis integral membrane protein MurJ [Armatimonadota bacterium]